MSSINITFDFTTDTPNYWTDFWNRNDGLGAGGNDPDAASPTLKHYHQLLWSRELPNGQRMILTPGSGTNYLSWNNFRFGSDSIAASFRYHHFAPMLKKVQQIVPDYQSWMENFIRKTYTIGGTILFPKHWNSINQCRGRHPLIRDRWDLTLECIRRYYAGINSPLSEILAQDKLFFDLFVDFHSYVDFFFLQDCVTSNYDEVQMWAHFSDFTQNPLPYTAEEYLRWLEQNLEFVTQRNLRIKAYCDKISR